jgi:DNA-binding CsgD family transcriptional regulator
VEGNLASSENAGKDDIIGLQEGLAGILALLVAQREERSDETLRERRTEVLLANAGLTNAQISRILGKKADTVRKAIERSRNVAAKATNR